MKKLIVAIIAAGLVGGTAMADVLASWTFSGSPVDSMAATSADADMASGGQYLDLTRGNGAPSSAGDNSFRTTGFRNDGISTSNDDYFQVVLAADSGFALSLDSIDFRYAGTASFSAASGPQGYAEMQWAYSLDGSSFNLIGTPNQVVNSQGNINVDLSGVGDLQDVEGDVFLRFYASGNTTTGGWGFNSLTTGGGQPGLEFNGSLAVIPEPSVFALLAIGGLAAARFARRRKD